MGWPAITVEIDLINDPLTANASNFWFDRTVDVFSFNITRGRQDELGRIEAGRADITFDNAFRDYNPDGTIGSVGLQPTRKVRISAAYSAVVYRLYTGYIEDIAFEYSRAIDARMTLACIDAFKYFALKKLNGAYTNEFTNWSIDTWLTNIDWPAADRALSSGLSQVQAGTFVNVPALTHFRNAEATESGLFFIDGQGRPTFHDRHYRLENSTTSAATFGDALDGSELPYLDFGLLWNDSYIWNEARITRTGGTEQVAEDTASQAEFFTRTYTATLPLQSDTEALSLAEWFVSRYSEPAYRFTYVRLDGRMSDSLWPHMLGRAIGDRITIVSRVIGDEAVTTPANVITQECYIEGIRHEVDGGEGSWITTFQLSPADSLTYWVLEDATLGVLDVTTRLAY